jgi:hypothetical protein
VSHAVLGHHAADQQFCDAELGQLLFERRLLEAVRKLFDHHRGVWGSGEDAGVDVCTGRAFVEEWGNPLGDVLNVNDRNTMSVGLLDGPLNVLKDDIRVPQRNLPPGK